MSDSQSSACTASSPCTSAKLLLASCTPYMACSAVLGPYCFGGATQVAQSPSTLGSPCLSMLTAVVQKNYVGASSKSDGMDFCMHHCSTLVGHGRRCRHCGFCAMCARLKLHQFDRYRLQMPATTFQRHRNGGAAAARKLGTLAAAEHPRPP